MFSEGTVHGARPWTSDSQRRIALYRFAPATCCYGRSYYPHWPGNMYDAAYSRASGEAPRVTNLLDLEGSSTSHAGTASGDTVAQEERLVWGLTPTQRAVLEPPYALRIDRPVISEDPGGGAARVTVCSRSEAKKAFDYSVFGTTYF